MAFLSSRTMIIILTLITAAVHLMLGLTQPDSTIFLLNGIGYLVLLYLTLWTPGALKGQAGLIRWVFIAYTAVTIIAYFAAWGLDGFTQVMGIITKAVELLLIVGLLQSRGD
ncbi:MAG TPA: hypothetical protein VMN57_01620 [Anaerolineales bacterium]|nr:hypothetical protein [Anaerolineales bacterium]